MRDNIATYRGYAIHVSLGVNWSFAATPLTPDRPILGAPNGEITLRGTQLSKPRSSKLMIF
jgi:hypothetical protein